MKNYFQGLIYSEDGAVSAEYAIMASLIAAVIAGTVASLGTVVLNMFSSVRFS